MAPFANLCTDSITIHGMWSPGAECTHRPLQWQKQMRMLAGRVSRHKGQCSQCGASGERPTLPWEKDARRQVLRFQSARLTVVTNRRSGGEGMDRGRGGRCRAGVMKTVRELLRRRCLLS